MDIRCVRIQAYEHKGEVLVNVQQIIPLPEAEAYQVKVREQQAALVGRRAAPAATMRAMSSKAPNTTREN